MGDPYPTVGTTKLMQNHINDRPREGDVSIGFIGLIVVILILNLLNLNQNDRKPAEPDSQIRRLMNDWKFLNQINIVINTKLH